MSNTRTIDSLKSGEQIIFKIYSDIFKKKIYEIGSFVMKLSNNSIDVNWLEGYKDRHDTIPFEDIIAVSDPNGEMMHFDNIYGTSVLIKHEA